MPWDLTPEEADKFNRLSKGEKVDLSSDEATKFQPIFAERSKMKKPQEEPGLGSLALNAMKEMVVPSREEVSTPGNPLVGMRQNALTQAGAVLSAFDIGAHRLPFVSDETQHSAEQLLDEGRRTYPKTALLTGLVAPFPNKTKEQMLVAGGLGALHGYQHAEPGKKLSGALTGGAVNAVLTGVMGKVVEGGSKLAGPALRKFAARLGVDLEKLVAEPKTVPEGPLDVAARQNAAVNARGGEPSAVPQNLAEVWNFPDPALTKVGEGAVTRSSLRSQMPQPEPGTAPLPMEPGTRGGMRPEPGTKPSMRQQLAELLNEEPPTDLLPEPGATSPGRRPLPGEPTLVDRPYLPRSLRKAQRVPEGEPITETGLSARARRMMENGPLPGEPNTAGKLDVVRGMNAERPTVVDDPRMAEFLRESGFNEAASAADRGEPDAMLKWLKDNPQSAKMAEQAGLVHASEYRKYAGPQELTKAPKTSSLRDEMGTKSLRAAPAEPSLDESLAWLSGEDTPEPKTLTKYVPRDSLLPKSQQNPEMTYVKSSRLKPEVGGGSGVPEEPTRPAAAQQSGPPVSAPLQPQDLDEMFGSLAAQSQQILANDSGLRAKFLRQFSLPEFRGDELLGHAVRSVNASRAIGDFQMQRLYPALQRTLEKLPSADKAEVANVISRLRDRKGTIADLSKLPQEFRDLFDQTQREQQGQLVELAKGGYFGPAELATISKNLKKGLLHLHRSYQAFYARKSWKPPDEAIEKASRYIANEAGIDPVQATARVRAILKTAAEGEGFKNVQQLLGAFRDAGLLKRRMLPAELHPLLGVVNDPAFVVADTASQMSSLYHLMLRTRGIVTPDLEGQTWSRQWMPGMDERPMWNENLGTAENKRLFGELAGKYVPPALRQSMLDVPPPMVENFARDFARKVTGWFSTAKVLTSPVTWARNIISNGLYLSASGVPMWRQLPLMKKAFSSIMAGQKRLSSGAAKGGEWLQMALEDGAVRPGRGTDLGGSEARAIAENVLRARPEEGLLGAWDSAMRLMQKGQLKLGKTYELFDSAARLAAYMHHVEAGKTRLGLTDQQARSHASHIVNRYFATGAGAAPIFRELSRSSLGLAPFIGWHVDNLRVAKNILADSLKGDIAPLMRTAGWIAAPMIAAYTARQMYGITDSDVAAGERALKGSWRDKQGFHDWLPVRGQDGKLTYAVSFDGLNPFALFARGAPTQSIPQRMAASIIQGMVQSGAMEPWVDEQLSNLGVTPEQYHPQTLPGQEGWKAASSVAQFMEPALLRQFRTVARKAQLDLGQPLRPTEEPQGLGEALMTTFSPIGIEKVGPRTQRGAQKQLLGERGSLLDARKRLKGVQDPNERQRTLDAIPERLKALRDRLK